MLGGRKWQPGRAEGTPEMYAEVLKDRAEARTDADISLEYGEDEQKTVLERYDEKTDELLLLNDGAYSEKTCLSVGERVVMRVLDSGDGSGVDPDPCDGWTLAGAYAWARGLTEEEVEAVGDTLNEQYWDAFRDVFQEYTQGAGSVVDNDYEKPVPGAGEAPETVAYDGGTTDMQPDPETFMAELRQEAAPTLGDSLREINDAAPLTVWDNLTVSRKYVRARMEQE